MYFVHIADMGFFEPNCIELCLKILNYLTVYDVKRTFRNVRITHFWEAFADPND